MPVANINRSPPPPPPPPPSPAAAAAAAQHHSNAAPAAKGAAISAEATIGTATATPRCIVLCLLVDCENSVYRHCVLSPHPTVIVVVVAICFVG
jgi:hypothetical protein